MRFLFVSVIFFLMLLAPVFAADEEGFVFSQLRPILENRIATLERAGATRESIEALSDEYFDSVTRIAKLESNRAHNTSWNQPLLDYLNQSYLPRMRKLGTDWRVQFDKQKPAFERRQAAQRALVAAKTEELRTLYQQASATHPQLSRVLQLTSMLRSDTLGEGKIGAINPNSADQIQSSAKAGLVSVLDRFDQTAPKDFDISISALQSYQAQMLGKAEHINSHPGRINDIYFRDDDGKRIHVREVLKDFEKRFNKPDPTLADAFDGYQALLHYHPFGDSNGRSAELIKQVLLARQGLPPIITREKTAVENFFFQECFGTPTLPPREALTALDETEQYVKMWDNALKGGWKIDTVDFSGQNVIVTAQRGSERRALVSARVFETNSSLLPPVRSAPVLADTPAEKLKMRVTTDGWNTKKDIAPTQVLRPSRMGSPAAAYVMYDLPIPEGTTADSISFAYYYDHPFERKKIWFNNSSMNYSTRPKWSPSEQGMGCGLRFKTVAPEQ